MIEGGCTDWQEWPDPWHARMEEDMPRRRLPRDWAQQYLISLNGLGGGIARTIFNDTERKALGLLRRHLTDEQWETLGTKGYFEVIGRRRHLGRMRKHVFRIHDHCAVYEHKPTGRTHYCIMAMEPDLPGWDWMLMVKMLIESDLGAFYDTARKRNWQPLERYDH